MTKVSEKQPWPIHRVSNNLIHPLPSGSQIIGRVKEGEVLWKHPHHHYLADKIPMTITSQRYFYNHPDTFWTTRIHREADFKLMIWKLHPIHPKKRLKDKFDGFIRYKLGKARVWNWVWDILLCNRSKRWHFYGATHIYIQTKPPAQDIMLRFITESERKLHFHCRFSQETHI